MVKAKALMIASDKVIPSVSNSLFTIIIESLISYVFSILSPLKDSISNQEVTFRGD